MKRHIIVLSFGLALWFGLLGCGIVNTLVSNVAGGSKGNTVANLWSDVPPIPGAQMGAYPQSSRDSGFYAPPS